MIILILAHKDKCVKILALAFISTSSPRVWAAAVSRISLSQTRVGRVTGVCQVMDARAFHKRCPFKWLHLLNVHARHLRSIHAFKSKQREVNFHRGRQNLRVITAPNESWLQRALKGCEKSMLLWRRRGAKQQIQTHMDVDLQPGRYSVPSAFLFFFLRMCTTINSKGTLRSGSYTLFI